MAVQTGFKSKADELEAYFKRYPDVPKEAIVKSDLVHLGVQFTESALKVGEGYLTKDYVLFTWDLDGRTKDESQVGGMPEYMDLVRGPYGLRKTKVRVRPNSQAPYLVDVVDGKLMLCGIKPGGYEPIAELDEYWRTPKYYSKVFEDGTPYKRVVAKNPGAAYVIALETCQHWARKEECLYCDINENYRAPKGGKAPNPVKKLDQVSEVLREIFFVEDWPLDQRPLCTLINGGAITSKVNGLGEIDFYLQYVRAAKSVLRNRWPVGLMTQSLTREEAKKCLEAGVDYHCPNLEVWDKNLFKVICPGKARVFSYDEYLRRIIEEVDLFGEGNVISGIVSGVEMAVPGGFKDVASAVKSMTEGFDFLMSHGVIPRPTNWAREPHSALRDSPPVPLDYYIQICRNYYELWCKYRLPEPHGYTPIGVGRAEYANGAFWDMGDPR